VLSAVAPAAGASRRALRATAVAAPLACLAACLEWGGLLSERWPGDLSRYLDIANRTFAGGIPYHDFYDEYPPLSLPAFLLPRAISERHYDLVFKLLMVACWVVALWVVARLLARLGASRLRMAAALGVMVVTPPLLGPVFLNRYDPYAALLGVLGIALLVSGREQAAAGWLSAGFMAKVFPVAGLPVCAIALGRTRGRHVLIRCTLAFAAVGLAIGGFFLVVAFGGLGYSYRSQLTRGLQIESVGSSLLLVADKLGIYTAHPGNAPPGQIDLIGRFPDLVADLSFGVEIVAILAVAWAYWRGRDEPERLLSAFAASVVAYTVFSKVLSPQYLTWLVPLVAVTRARLATLLLLLALPLTQAEVYWGKHGLRELNWSIWLLVVRNALLVGVFAVMLAQLRRGADAEGRRAPAGPAG